MGTDQTQPQVETPRAARLEIAHVLFTDIVGYSRLPMDQQTKVLRQLQEIIRGTEEFREAQALDQLITLPTGDGMALVFFGSPEDPVQCAIQLSRALRTQPELKLRMGVHTGPVYRVSDINTQMNVAGGGINMAQRIMDCGDTGNILVSKTVADMLSQVSGWDDRLHDIGEAEVKHGVRVHLFNLVADGVGNPEVPHRLRRGQLRNRPRLFSGIRAGRPFVASALGALVVIVVVFYFLFNNHRSAITEKDTILLADFINATGDATFDGSTLKQALAVQLRQTPFLNLFPEEGVHETLRYMGRSESERITPQIGREICQRRGLKALLVGTISSLGRHYVITLEAADGLTGETIASRQLEAENKEQVLSSLGQAALDLRKQLGESLSTLQKYNAPIEQATTPSLEALNVYSKGLEQIYGGDYKAALPLFNRAVELDLNFAEAYLWLSWTYSNFGDLGKAGEFAAKAYTLRDRVTELEKLHIDEIYHLFATGDFEKQKEADGLIKRLYPNDWLAPASLGYGHLRIGHLEQALTEFREAIRANPNESHLYGNISDILMRLNRFDEARETIKQARTRNLDLPGYRHNLYLIDLTQGDDTETQQQLETIRKIDGEASALTEEAGAAIFSGRWRKAQELYHRAAALSGTPSPSGTNATLPVAATIAGALFGFCQPATQDVRQALAISRLKSPVQIMYVPVLANGSLCGDAGEAQNLADEQLRRYPNATLLNVYSEPIIRAAIALQRNRADQAIEFLNAAIPYEGGDAAFWPHYLRGQAYLRLRRGDEAAAELQKIPDHRGWDPVSLMYPLAHVGLARSAALAGDTAKARKAYQDFLALWKDADPDIPILIEAKKEYEQLK